MTQKQMMEALLNEVADQAAEIALLKRERELHAGCVSKLEKKIEQGASQALASKPRWRMRWI